MADPKPFTPEAAERLARKLADWNKPVDPVEAFSGKGFRHMGAGPRKHASFAHFPGTGPAGQTCRNCDFLRARTRIGDTPDKTVCAKFKQLQPGAKATTIDWRSDACKYFQIRAGKVVNE
ncbi:MAG: hypothetical protein WA210_00850 [Burkholderiaceae bacterium]